MIFVIIVVNAFFPLVLPDFICMFPMATGRAIGATQRELDGEAALVAQRQDESDAARKTLIELSRDFKRSAAEVYQSRRHFDNKLHVFSRCSTSRRVT